MQRAEGVELVLADAEHPFEVLGRDAAKLRPILVDRTESLCLVEVHAPPEAKASALEDQSSTLQEQNPSVPTML